MIGFLCCARLCRHHSRHRVHSTPEELSDAPAGLRLEQLALPRSLLQLLFLFFLPAQPPPPLPVLPASLA